MKTAGFGFRASTSLASLQDALDRASSGTPVGQIATAADKTHHDAFLSLAARVGVPVMAVAPEAIEAQETLTASGPSQTARATGSLAEAAALAAAGPGARLLARRVVSRDRLATCAIAEEPGT
ncbi:MAG: cobalamin biosynthesis protein [Pseudomonadota bacterium]